MAQTRRLGNPDGRLEIHSPPVRGILSCLKWNRWQIICLRIIYAWRAGGIGDILTGGTVSIRATPLARHAHQAPDLARVRAPDLGVGAIPPEPHALGRGDINTASRWKLNRQAIRSSNGRSYRVNRAGQMWSNRVKITSDTNTCKLEI